jgi:hypothetical protein
MDRIESREFSKTIVAQVEGRDVTQGELAAAFDWVADKAHWKNPIDCVVALSPRQVALVREAVPFFTGSKARVEVIDEGVVRIRAAGYFATIGA